MVATKKKSVRIPVRPLPPRQRTIILEPPKFKVDIVFGGYGGGPGMKSRKMTIDAAHKLVKRTSHRVVMRENARPSVNLDIPGASFGAAEGEITAYDDLPQLDGDFTDAQIPRTRSAAQTRKSEALNWLETEKILVDVMYQDIRRKPCQCTRHRYRKRVRFISLDSYVVRDVDYCQCPAACSDLISEGFFPSMPRRPGTVFSLRLLRTLHAQSALGSVSKQAWIRGLHMIFEEDLNTVLPSFEKELRDAYHHWVAVRYEVDTRLSKELEVIETQDEQPSSGSWLAESLRNLCPACYDIAADDSDKSIAFSLDGNVQHCRYKDQSPYEFKVLIPKLFVDYGRRRFSLAGNVERGGSLLDGCGHRFKATNGWNKAESAATTKKAVDETGLMAVTCFHGIGVRYLNLYGGNERYTHAMRLLEAMHEDCPAATKMHVCYDVACEFQSTVRSYEDAWLQDVSVRIGRFHLYGHQLRCHILFNLLRTEGFGLMIGEEVEQLWWMLSHLIKSGKTSSGPRRTQKIDSCGLLISQRQRENMGGTIFARWIKMTQVRDEAQRVLDGLLDTTVPERTDKSGHVHPETQVTREYLDAQATDQVQFYESYRYSARQSRDDRIFRALQRERALRKSLPLRAANRVGRPGSAEREAAIARVEDYTFEQLQNTRAGAAAVRQTVALLEQAEATREEWHPEGELYRRSERRVTLTRLQQLQTEIIRTVTERRVELDVLHSRVKGGKMAKKFIAQINGRWKALDKLVNEYNVQVNRHNEDAAEDAPLRTLSAHDLRENGVDNADGEVWDVERLMSNADWAVHDIVRQGIDANFRRQRTVEEEARLLLNVERICRWLAQQTEVLVRALESDLSIAMKKLIRIQLLHRDKVVLSFLRKVRKHGNLMMTAMQLQHLQELHEQIVGVLGTQLEHDVDHVDAEGDELLGDGADDETDYGDFDDEFAERLMQEFERQMQINGEADEDLMGEWQYRDPDEEEGFDIGEDLDRLFVAD